MQWRILDRASWWRPRAGVYRKAWAVRGRDVARASTWGWRKALTLSLAGPYHGRDEQKHEEPFLGHGVLGHGAGAAGDVGRGLRGCSAEAGAGAPSRFGAGCRWCYSGCGRGADSGGDPRAAAAQSWGAAFRSGTKRARRQTIFDAEGGREVRVGGAELQSRAPGSGAQGFRRRGGLDIGERVRPEQRCKAERAVSPRGGYGVRLRIAGVSRGRWIQRSAGGACGHRRSGGDDLSGGSAAESARGRGGQEFLARFAADGE